MAVEKKGDTDSTGAAFEGVSPDTTKLVEKGSSGGDGVDRPSGGGGGGDKGGGKSGSGKSGGAPNAKKEEKKGNQIAQLIQFLKEVVIEFKKITWPERSQIIKETWSVLFLVTAITLMVLALDWVLAHAIFQPLENWLRLHGAGVGHGL